MLVLSRKESQTIVLDDLIVVKVISISGTTVKLGIDAPRHIQIIRGEIADKNPDSVDPKLNPPSAVLSQG